MASGSDRNPIIIGGLPSQVPDFDPEETREWLDSLDAAVDERGRERARYLMLRLIERAREKRVAVPEMRSTDYVNTIATKDEPFFPGDEEIERKILNATRWNAAVMVSRAQRPGIGVGGHIATFASSASLYDVGFNHFFRGKDQGDGGDQIFFQGHASPGIYARAFLLDRLSEAQLDAFRQEKSKAPNGLSSYPHPRLMPDFWEFPTVSMGLGPLGAIYQARMNRYMEARGIADTSKSHVWAYLGDGEMDEPESLGQLSIAAREGLDNLTFVVNCNLQRLDGPVRGNGKIIQELESQFRGAGWNVIKLVWDRSWDPLLAQDRTGILVNRLNTTPDGQFQTYATETGEYIREHFFGDDPRLRDMVKDMTDQQILHLGRGGHDHRKVYAAYAAAKAHKGQPTVILAQTVKGWTLGPNFEGRNATHQMKKLTVEDLKRFRDRLHIPITDKQLDEGYPPYYHPGRDSEEIQYMHDRRQGLGGYVPTRVVRAKPLPQPEDKTYAAAKKGSGTQSIATTMAFVRVLKDLMRDKEIGKRFVLIAPDEYRTFGMDAFFPSAKIYNPLGQQYEAVDRDLLLAYKESPTGQMLHDGISEAGCTASLIAAGSAYATHGEPLIPVYVFYSMFGFQRTGDQFWQMADQLARGFVLGATMRPYDADRRGAPARGRPLAAARLDEPGLCRVRPGLRVRDRAHHEGRAAPDVRRGERGRLLLPHRLQRADPAPGRAAWTWTSRASSRASTASPRARRARSRPRSWRPVWRSPGPWRRRRSSRTSGTSRRTSGRRPPGTSCAARRWTWSATTSCTRRRSSASRT